MGTPHIRGAARAALTGLASLSLVTGALIAAGAPQAAAMPAADQAASSHSVSNPYSPAYNHPYRHGVTPTLQQSAKMKSWAASQATPNAATGPETLSYGGGIDGIGVQSGHSKVYLVFYGNQWGTQSTDANGNAKFSGDSAGAAGRRAADVQGHRHQQRAVVRGPDAVVRRSERGLRGGQLPVERQLHPVPGRWRALRCLVRQRGRLPGAGVRPPARCRGRQRGRPLRQHHGRREPRRVLHHPVAPRHQPGRLREPHHGVLRVARLER